MRLWNKIHGSTARQGNKTCFYVFINLWANFPVLNLICTTSWAADWQCSGKWSEIQSCDCDITNHSSSCPGKGVIALVPVHTTPSATFKMTGFETHKVFRPAIRECVAHDPPSITLCLPSKKSAFRTLARPDLNEVWIEFNNLCNRGTTPMVRILRAC